MMKTRKWLNVEFESSTTKTEQFKAFVRDLRSDIKRLLPSGATLARFSVGHFEVYGNVERDGKYVYFSVSDVRYWQNAWNDHILIRTCTDVKDYTGGANNYTPLSSFTNNVEQLLNR